MPRIAGFDLAALRRSRLYDLAMRLPVLSYSLFLALFSVFGLLHDRRGAGSAMAHAVDLAMRLAVIAYFVVLAASVIGPAGAPGRRRRQTGNETLGREAADCGTGAPRPNSVEKPYTLLPPPPRI